MWSPDRMPRDAIGGAPAGRPPQREPSPASAGRGQIEADDIPLAGGDYPLTPTLSPTSRGRGRRDAIAPGALAFLWRFVLLLALAETSLIALMSPLARAPAAALQLCVTVTTLFVAFLLVPSLHGRREGVRAGILAAWSIAGSLAVPLLLAVNGRNGIELTEAVSAAVGVLAAMLMLCGALAVLASLGMAAENAYRVVLIAGVLSGTAPLWLGPLAATWPGAPDIAVRSSLLSYLAAMADYDVLRNQWFYQHTPLGGMRYEYPPALSTTLLLAAAGTLGLITAALRERIRRGEDLQPFALVSHLHEESAR